MTLPAAYATISMGDINVELGRSRTSTISLNTAENGGYATINTNSTSRPSSSDPASISEWYSYNHNASPPSTPPTFYWSFIRQGPSGGLLTIRKNGTQVVSSSTNGASGTISVVNGDIISATVTQSTKIDDTTSVTFTNQSGYLDSVYTFNGNTTFQWTLSNNNQYSMYAAQETVPI